MAGYSNEMVTFGDELEAPLLQHMNLEEHDAVAVIQQTQWSEVFIQLVGIPYEQANQYRIVSVPDVSEDMTPMPLVWPACHPPRM